MAFPVSEEQKAIFRRRLAATARELQPPTGSFAESARARQAAANDRANGIMPVRGPDQPAFSYQDHVGNNNRQLYGNSQANRGGNENAQGYVPHPSPRIPAAPVPSNGYDEPGVTLPNAMPVSEKPVLPGNINQLPPGGLAMPVRQQPAMASRLPPLTPQDVAAISRSQAEGRGADSLREKIAGIMAAPAIQGPVMDSPQIQAMRAQKDANVRTYGSMGRSPEMQDRMESGYNKAMGIGQPTQAGEQPQSIFQRQAPPNNRMQGSVPVGPSRDMSGANGVRMGELRPNTGNVAYVPGNGTDGSVGSARYVEGRRIEPLTPGGRGTVVQRGPNGGMELIGDELTDEQRQDYANQSARIAQSQKDRALAYKDTRALRAVRRDPKLANRPAVIGALGRLPQRGPNGQLIGGAAQASPSVFRSQDGSQRMVPQMDQEGRVVGQRPFDVFSDATARPAPAVRPPDRAIFGEENFPLVHGVGSGLGAIGRSAGDVVGSALYGTPSANRDSILPALVAGAAIAGGGYLARNAIRRPPVTAETLFPPRTTTPPVTPPVATSPVVPPASPWPNMNGSPAKPAAPTPAPKRGVKPSTFNPGAMAPKTNPMGGMNTGTTGTTAPVATAPATSSPVAPATPAPVDAPAPATFQPNSIPREPLPQNPMDVNRPPNFNPRQSSVPSTIRPEMRVPASPAQTLIPTNTYESIPVRDTPSLSGEVLTDRASGIPPRGAGVTAAVPPASSVAGTTAAKGMTPMDELRAEDPNSSRLRYLARAEASRNMADAQSKGQMNNTNVPSAQGMAPAASTSSNGVGTQPAQARVPSGFEAALERAGAYEPGISTSEQARRYQIAKQLHGATDSPVVPSAVPPASSVAGTTAAQGMSPGMPASSTSQRGLDRIRNFLGFKSPAVAGTTAAQGMAPETPVVDSPSPSPRRPGTTVKVNQYGQEMHFTTPTVTVGRQLADDVDAMMMREGVAAGEGGSASSRSVVSKGMKSTIDRLLAKGYSPNEIADDLTKSFNMAHGPDSATRPEALRQLEAEKAYLQTKKTGVPSTAGSIATPPPLPAPLPPEVAPNHPEFAKAIREFESNPIGRAALERAGVYEPDITAEEMSARGKKAYADTHESLRQQSAQRQAVSTENVPPAKAVGSTKASKALTPVSPAAKWLSGAEAAQMYGIDANAIERARESGQLKRIADRGVWKFRAEEIDSFVKGTVPPASAAATPPSSSVKQTKAAQKAAQKAANALAAMTPNQIADMEAAKLAEAQFKAAGGKLPTTVPKTPPVSPLMEGVSQQAIGDNAGLQVKPSGSAISDLVEQYNRPSTTDAEKQQIIKQYHVAKGRLSGNGTVRENDYAMRVLRKQVPLSVKNRGGFIAIPQMPTQELLQRATGRINEVTPNWMKGAAKGGFNFGRGVGGQMALDMAIQAAENRFPMQQPSGPSVFDKGGYADQAVAPYLPNPQSFREEQARRQSFQQLPWYRRW